MKAEQLAVVQGWDDTRATLKRWNANPWPVARSWALGSRYVHGGGVENWDLTRRFISLAGCEYARRVLGVQIRDLTGGFKCFRAAPLQRINAQTAGAQGYAFQVELTYRTLLLGLKVVEAPIRFR